MDAFVLQSQHARTNLCQKISTCDPGWLASHTSLTTSGGVSALNWKRTIWVSGMAGDGLGRLELAEWKDQTMKQRRIAVIKKLVNCLMDAII